MIIIISEIILDQPRPQAPLSFCVRSGDETNMGYQLQIHVLGSLTDDVQIFWIDLPVVGVQGVCTCMFVKTLLSLYWSL